MAPGLGRTLAHYRRIEKIGEGGMGEVYRAEDTRLERQVAIKLLRPEVVAIPERRHRFLKEARTAAGLTHPNIAVVHAVDESDGQTFIVMEMVEGLPLSNLIRSGPVELSAALKIAGQIASGLARAHHARIVHRDLKPDNIIVAQDHGVKILDFGLARILNETCPLAGEGDPAEKPTLDASMTGRLAGTAAYMSPEQARGERVDARSDVFAFGAVLYELLTGVSPFAGATLSATLARVIDARPGPLGVHRSDLPEKLEAIVARCLSPDRAARYADALEINEELSSLRRLLALGAPAAGAGLPATTIAVLPFAMRGNPEHAWLSAGVVDLMSTKLDGAGEIRSVDPHAVLCCGAADDGVVDPAEGARRARKLGAGMFVMGSILGAGDQVQLEAALYDAGGARDVIARASVRGQSAAIFDMVDQLTVRLLADRFGEPATRLHRVAALATGSFPALKAYLEGEGEMRAMRRVAAAEAYARAVELDPAFALAWYRLSVASFWSGQSARARQACISAVAHAGRLSERDRSLMEAFASAVRGDNAEAERRFRTIVGTYPEDAEAWYQLAELLFHYGPVTGRPLAASRPAWERLIQLDPRHVNAMWHLAIVEWFEGSQERFEARADQVIALSPRGDAALWARVFRAGARGAEAELGRVKEDLSRGSDYSIAFAAMTVGGYLGDASAALSVAELLVAPIRGADVRARGHVIRAYLECSRGRRSAAMAELDRAEGLDPMAVLEARVLLGTIPEAPTDGLPQLRDQIGRERSAVSEQPLWLSPHRTLREPIDHYLLGLIALRLGQPQEAVARAAALESADEPEEAGSLLPDLALSLRAQVARMQGRGAEALELLEGLRMQARFDQMIWSPLFSHALPRILRAELLEEAGRVEEAASWYRSFEENSLFDRIYAAVAIRGMARVFEKMGDSEAARAALTRARLLRPDPPGSGEAC